VHSAKVNSVNNAANYKGERSGSEDHVESVPDEYAGKRIDQALALLLPVYSRSRLQQWIRQGLVTIDGQSCSVKSKVWGGEKISLKILPDASELAFRPEDIPLTIVHEDGAILIVDKPAGLVVHPGNGNWSGTLLNALLQYLPENASLPRAGIVHRLDKDTSGLLIVAKTLPAHTDLVRQMQKRSIGREYAAIAYGVVTVDGTVDAAIGRHPRDRKRMAVVERGKSATTHYSVVERGAGWTLLHCRLETGRTHQIRVHLSSIGHALIGDPVYKTVQMPSTIPAAAKAFPRQALHAKRLRVVHPDTGVTMHWDSPLPQDLVDLLDCLRNG
jgi:23S rRNA pseudouridine1911/1915/1917 synthase